MGSRRSSGGRGQASGKRRCNGQPVDDIRVRIPIRKALLEMKSGEKAVLEMKSGEKTSLEMKSDEKALSVKSGEKLCLR